jgi:hypothetical protein
MRSLVPAAALMTLIGACGLAIAQTAAPPKTDDSQAEKAQHTEAGRAGKAEPLPPTAAPADRAAPPAAQAAQPQAPGPVLVNGRLNVPGAPADSQTVPSKYSERNAALDRLPIMAMPLGLSEEQRRTIVERVKKSDAPVVALDAKLTEELPSSVALNEWPDGLGLPAVKDLKYVRLSDRILLVIPSNRIVVGEIKG